MRVYYSYAASGNPHLSYGKAGRLLERELETVCDLVPQPSLADLQLYLGIPHFSQRDLWRKRAARFVWFTMWEASAVPKPFVRRINATDGLLTPCPWTDRIFTESGVTVPRSVVPLGVDTDAYPFEEKGDGPFTFLWVGVTAAHIRQLRAGKPIGDRKRGWLVRKAFEDLNIPGTRLILKSIPYPSTPADFTYRTRAGAEIREMSCYLPEEEMAALYRQADVLVWPTWGEGFGLPPLEAAASGTAAMVPNWSGIEAFFDPAWCIGLPYEVRQIWRHRPRLTGACVTLEDLKAKMRWAAMNRDTVREMGRAGATAVRPRWSWEHATRPALRDVLTRHEREAA